jgi:hypothetical protein
MDITNLQVRITRDLIQVEIELALPNNSKSRTEILLNIKDNLESVLGNFTKLKLHQHEN